MHENMVQFAERCGVSKVTIFNHCKRGRLIRTKKGIDPDLPTNREYVELCQMRKAEQAQQVKQPKPESISKPKSKPVSKPAKKKPRAKRKPADGNGNGNNSDSINAQVEIELLSRHEAERLKTIEQVFNYQIKTQKERQELIERSLVKRVWAKLYAVDTAELHPLGEKIAADLAAEFKSDDSEAILRVRKIIDRHIFKALQHSKRLMDDFLKQVGEEEI